jgi:predicted acyl esterase
LARADVVELPGAPLDKKALMTGSASATLQVLESGGGDIVVKLVDRRPDGEVRLLRETVVVLGGAGSVTVNFSGLAYEFDAGSAPGLLIAGASLPAFRSVTPPLSGQVRLGAAQLRLPLSP